MNMPCKLPVVKNEYYATILLSMYITLVSLRFIVALFILSATIAGGHPIG